MSHFTVLVKIDAEAIAKHGSAEKAVDVMLRPYQENNMDNCPSEFLKFTDKTDEIDDDWKNKMIDCYRLANGKLVFSWDNRFKQPVIEDDGTTHSWKTKSVCPDNAEKVNIHLNEMYESFELYVEEWQGYSRCGSNNEYGYWENPNATWDWFQIGGRWTGYFPVKNNAGYIGEGSLVCKPLEDATNLADICQISDLDIEKIQANSQDEIDKFCEYWKKYDYGRNPEMDWHAKSYCRSFALKYDLLDCKDKGDITGEVFLTIPWDKEKTPERFDVWKCPVSENDIRTKYSDFFAPLRTYAVLDNDGWHAASDMGWWGMSLNTSAEQTQEYNENWFDKFIESEPDSTWLAIVDCHI